MIRNNTLANIKEQARKQLETADGFFLVILDKEKYAHHLYFGKDNLKTGDIIMHTEALLQAIKDNIIEKVNMEWFGRQLKDEEPQRSKDRSYFG